MRGRRGYALHHVFAAVAVAAALTAGWAPAFRVALLSSARGTTRAEARAVANAAWARARVALVQGKDPTRADEALLNGRVSVELERQGSRVLLRVNARTQRQGDWIHSRIEIELRVVASGSARSVVVLRRTELGA